MRKVYVISGVSGGGKSQALKAFEDFGFYCVDNLPLALLSDFLDLLNGSKRLDKVALGVDIREGDRLKGFEDSLGLLRKKGLRVRVIFLDASDPVLIQRFSETRHRHPLGQHLGQAIVEERRRLIKVKALADKVIDTSGMTLGELKEKLSETLELTQSKEMSISVTSFGYKYGLPMDADIVMDVRFLPNPNYVRGLRQKTGLDPRVGRYLSGRAPTRKFLGAYCGLLKPLLPRYVREGKSYLTLAIGCTGGRHRSVYVAHAVAASLKRLGYNVREFHRDLGR